MAEKTTDELKEPERQASVTAAAEGLASEDDAAVLGEFLQCIRIDSVLIGIQPSWATSKSFAATLL
jgi:hypothetical protein